MHGNGIKKACRDMDLGGQASLHVVLDEWGLNRVSAKAIKHSHPTNIFI